MRTFQKHQFGRIYVNQIAHIERVKERIKELDPRAYALMPENFVACFTRYPEVVNVGQFCELDMDVLSAHCMCDGISVFCFDAGRQEQPIGCL